MSSMGKFISMLRTVAMNEYFFYFQECEKTARMASNDEVPLIKLTELGPSSEEVK